MRLVTHTILALSLSLPVYAGDFEKEENLSSDVDDSLASQRYIHTNPALFGFNTPNSKHKKKITTIQALVFVSGVVLTMGLLRIRIVNQALLDDLHH